MNIYRAENTGSKLCLNKPVKYILFKVSLQKKNNL